MLGLGEKKLGRLVGSDLAVRRTSCFAAQEFRELAPEGSILKKLSTV